MLMCLLLWNPLGNLPHTSTVLQPTAPLRSSLGTYYSTEVNGKTLQH